MTSYMNYCICRDTNIYRSCLQDGYGFAVATIYSIFVGVKSLFHRFFS